MPYTTVTTHSIKYPATSVMAVPYSCDNTGYVSVTAGINQLKADQANSGTMLVPAGTYLVGSNLSIPVDMSMAIYRGAQFSIATSVVLTLVNPTAVSAGKGLIFTGNGKVDFAAGSVVRTSWFDGIVNLLDHLQGSSNITVIFDMDETIATNLTVPANIKVCGVFGVTLTINNAVTMTINGPVDISNTPTFAYVGTGSVVYTDISTGRNYVFPQMWGAVGNGIADDTIAMQSAFDAGLSLGFPVYLPAGTYLCSNLLYGENASGAESDGPPEIYGDGSSSILKVKGGTVGIFFKAENLKGKSFHDFAIDGNDVGTVTVAFDTDWYSAGVVLRNRYSNLTIYNYGTVGWSALNNSYCNTDNIVIIDPKDSNNQKALDISGDIINLTNLACEGYIAFSGNTMKATSIECYGLDATADSVVINNSEIQSNSVTAACVAGTIKMLTVIGGSFTTVTGRNAFDGTYDAGMVIIGAKFDGEALEDVFATGITGTLGQPTFFVYDCFVTATSTLNYPTTAHVVSRRSNINNTSWLTTPYVNPIAITYAFSGYQYTATDLSLTLFVVTRAGGGGGADSSGATHGSGGGGGGCAMKVFNAIDLTYPVTVTIGAKGVLGAPGTAGGTTSFGAYISAIGGGAGGYGSSGGAGGVGIGGDVNITGEAGGDSGGTPDATGGASFGLGGGPRAAKDTAGNSYGGGGGGRGDLGNGNAEDGAPGVCFIYEFPKELAYIAELLVNTYGYLGV